jgi:peptidoglycan/xylan/chitin deacetylase (PgdA/CDA1 family)
LYCLQPQPAAVQGGLLLMRTALFPSTMYLTWHGIGCPGDSISAEEARYWNSVDVFADTLAAVPEIKANHGISVRMTFDDGNQSDYSQAFRLLRQHDQTGIFFVCASRINQTDYLSTSELREMYAAGMTIGSHGFDHINWSVASEDQLEREFVAARARIEDVLGAIIDTASVPFGMVDRRVAQWAITAGFSRLFTSSGGFATANAGLIPRNSIINGFDPAIDLGNLTALRCRAKSALRDPIRRLRYWGGPNQRFPLAALREKSVTD